MGNFSYLCSECEHPIRSDCHSGEHCILMVVDEGTVLEWMQGQYNGYGRVFKVDDDVIDAGNMPEDDSYVWTAVSHQQAHSLHWNGDSYSGIAAHHSGCFDGDMQNVCVSNDDPEQGDLDYERDKRKGKYTFPQRGSHSHGTTIKVQPKWTKAGEA